jgi:hypothetical protein
MNDAVKARLEAIRRRYDVTNQASSMLIAEWARLDVPALVSLVEALLLCRGPWIDCWRRIGITPT